MGRVCQLTGKKAMGGNNVSHSNNKTKRKFDINLIRKTFIVPETGEVLNLRITTSALKNVSKNGISATVKKAREKGYLKK
jgi:large subunit ribosomal protein L28